MISIFDHNLCDFLVTIWDRVVWVLSHLLIEQLKHILLFLIARDEVIVPMEVLKRKHETFLVIDGLHMVEKSF